MQMVIRLLGILLAALIALVLFAPKKELYYALEHRLERSGILLAEENLTERPNGLEIRTLRIFYQGAPVATIDRVALTTLLLRSTLELEGMRPEPGMEQFLPLSVDRLRAEHALWHPTTVSLEANGSFGHATGSLDLLRRSLRIESPDAGEVESLRPYLKNQEGRWIYESQF